MAQAAAPQISTTRLQLPADLVDQIPLLVPIFIKSVTDSLDCETVPAKYEGKTADEIFVKAMGDRGPAAKVARVTELQASITQLNSIIEASRGGGDLVADVEQSVKAKLVVAEAQLAKAQKDAPSQLSELKAVMEAKSGFEVLVQERRDQRRRGADKSAERETLRHAFIADARAQLTALEKGLNFVEAKNKADHADRASAIATMDEKVIKMFDDKIAVLQAASATRTPAPSYQYAMPPGARPSASLLLTLDDAAAEQASLKDLEEAQQRAAEAVANAEAARRDLEKRMANVTAQFEKTFELDPGELPKTTIPEDQLKLAALGSIHRATSTWGLGPMAPFQWDALDTEAGPGFEAVQVAKEVIGHMWALCGTQRPTRREKTSFHASSSSSSATA